MALVVGGSRGIGLAMARELLEGRFAGRVVVTGRTPSEVRHGREQPARRVAPPLHCAEKQSQCDEIKAAPQAPGVLALQKEHESRVTALALDVTDERQDPLPARSGRQFPCTRCRLRNCSPFQSVPSRLLLIS